MIEYGTELVVDRLEIYWRIWHVVLVTDRQHFILPVQHIYGFNITHPFASEIRQDLFLDDTVFSYPGVLPDTILQVVLVDLVERSECHIKTSGTPGKELTFPFERVLLRCEPTLCFSASFT